MGSKIIEMCDELGVKHLVHSGEDFQSSNHLYLTRIPGINDEVRREIIIKLAERGVDCTGKENRLLKNCIAASVNHMNYWKIIYGRR